MGRALSAALAEVGIHGPGDVTVTKLGELPKVGPTRAGRLRSAFIAAEPVYELARLACAAGLDIRLARRVVDAVGPAAPRLLRDDPWLLLGIGLTPEDADRFARLAIPGVRRDDPRRSRALVGYLLARQAREGHTVTPVPVVLDGLGEYGVAEPQSAIRAALESELVRGVDDGGAMLALAQLADAEQSVARAIARLTDTAVKIEVDPGKAPVPELDDAQLRAVHAALEAGVSILTGGPGTGKSRSVASIVLLAERAGKTVALAAPTGRAAKRLEELCGAPASTIHRLLGAQARQDGDELSFSGGFAKGADDQLEFDLIVVDEASMLDVELAQALLKACRDGTHLVLVGDAAQLPSIGPGRVLGDLIDSAA
ncbi:MAG TPA: AAA family ATPase, partial [Jatrophihabitantaceae bacterium]|nr:AAA family ATPase [Jatrophihabitantaceae bacterium]